MMRATFAVLVTAVLAWAGLFSGGVAAQENAWVQVEAQPTLAEAQQRAAAYAAAFPDVQGYRLGSRWYGIALGPYSVAGAAARIAELRRENMIPRDSFVTDGTNFREPFWPVSGDQPAAVAPVAEPPVAEAPAAEAPAAEASAPETPAATETPAETPVAEADTETPAEARRSEAALTGDERQDLQRALQWQGFYSASIDGAFGAGTRKSMASWQAAMGMQETGILTTRQRALLIANWQADMAEYGFETVTEAESGIEITLPMAKVKFDRYEPPFVHFAASQADGMRVILISQPGDKAALFGLYDVLQTLTIVPTEGERSRNDRSFDINATSATLNSFSHAEQNGGQIKGYILVWQPADAERAQRVLDVMKSSFRSTGNRSLDPGMVAMTDSVRKGLVSGLELRRPKFSRSGFYVDAKGSVVTTAEAVAQCGRITLDGVTEATVAATDAAAGIVLLTPARQLAPASVATLQLAGARLGGEIAVAGYSYEDALPAPVLTYGTLEDDKGLNGETGIKRLGIATLAGDAGGPVLDSTGAVIGLLQPRSSDGARVLPQGVEFAADAAVIGALMAQAGIQPADGQAMGTLPPDDLTRNAMGMTVLVSCWE